MEDKKNDFNKYLKESLLTTKQLVSQYKQEYIDNGYMGKILNQNIKEINQMKKERTIDNDLEFFQDEINKYADKIVSLIIKDYDSLISVNKIELLNKARNIEIIYDDNNEHDISANSEKGQVIVNVAKLGGIDIYSNLAIVKSALPHELFHIVITMLKSSKTANDRINILLKDGEQISSRGMVGFILNEGLVEKYSNEFCERHGLFYAKAPQYIPFVKISEYILNKGNNNDVDIFNSNFEDLLNNLKPSEKEAYLYYEALSFAIRHKGMYINNIESVKVEKIEPLNNNLTL